MKRSLLLIQFLILVSISMLGQKRLLEDNLQNEAESTFFRINPTLGGDVTVNSSKIEIEDNLIYKTFEVSCLESGAYFLNAWLLAPLTPDGYPEYKIAINNELISSSLKPANNSWESVKLTDNNHSVSTVRLKKGINTISFIAKDPEIPAIEFIRLSTSALRADISDQNYQDYLSLIESNNSISNLAVSSLEDTVSIQTRGTAGEEFTYIYNFDVPYTTVKSFNCRADGRYTFSATSTDPNYEFVLEVINARFPQAYSYSKKGKGNASIDLRSATDDPYYIRVRAYRQLIPGVVTLNLNGQVYSNCPVNGNGVAITGDMSGDRNYFTCHTTPGVVACIWIEQAPAPGVIKYFAVGNRDASDYNWSDGSKCLIPQWGTYVGALVSAFSSYSGSAKCDLYVGLPKSDASRGFPNLRPEDAIRTAPFSDVYNCISWTGDITSYWEWPLSTWSIYYRVGNPLGSFDAFYADHNYTRTGATASNAAVALWGTSSTAFTHGSITKNPNSSKPHGYSWESKPGREMRTFHPKDALRGSSYGTIQYYYKPVNTRSLTIKREMEAYSLSTEDINKISLLKELIENDYLVEFNQKYEDWAEACKKNEFSIYSDPVKYKEPQEYVSLLKLCEKMGKASIPLIAEKLQLGDFLAANFLEDLTLSAAKNKDILATVKDNVQSKARNGGYYAQSPYSNALAYVSELLKEDEVLIVEAINNMSEPNITSEIGSISINGSVLCVKCNVESGKGFLDIYDVYGTLVLQKNAIFTNGVYITDLSNLKSGVYIVNLTAETQVLTKKINLGN